MISFTHYMYISISSIRLNISRYDNWLINCIIKSIFLQESNSSDKSYSEGEIPEQDLLCIERSSPSIGEVRFYIIYSMIKASRQSHLIIGPYS